jgi:hypothetical protein
MPNYDFTALSSVDFENLVRDLLQKELKVTLESFKNGRDRGIDLRYSPDTGRDLIIQCKHYASTPYRKFLADLRKKELPKVKRLHPARYILATSVGLTPDNKDALVELFAPYCTSRGDVYGRDDLNNLPGKFPDVERLHFKLWLTSVTVLEQVIHSSVFNQTAADLERIRRKINYYVQNESFFEASRILEKNHYCIIAGIPGIGKTTLAEILLVNYVSQGFEAISVTNDISEAFEIYKKSVKQVFYYDDFLGQTSIDEKLGKNEDKNLLRFIDLVRESKTARFILTTREHILNRAKDKYEKLAQSKFDIHQCVISLADYTRFDRAKILFNHVYFSGLPPAYKESLLDHKGYQKIIDHKNFNPRIIEWMTEHVADLEIKSGDYLSHFMSNLDDPTRLWEHAFENQLSDAARHLLLVLASLPKDVRLEDLEMAFDSHHNYSAQRYNLKTSPNDFTQALKELESNFVQVEQKNFDTLVRFHNPSVRDFLERRFAARLIEVAGLCESAMFYEQFVVLWNINTSQTQTGTSNSTPTLLSFISQRPETFLYGMLRTFQSGDYSLRVEYDPEENTTVTYSRRHLPMEARLQFAVSVSETLYKSESFKRADFLLRPMFDELLEILNSNSGDKVTLISLLKHLKGDRIHNGIKHGIIPPTLLVTAKNFLMQDLKTLNDFTHFIEFKRIFGEAVAGQDIRYMENQFQRFLNQEVEYYLTVETDPDSVLNFAEEVPVVGYGFNADVEDDVDRLKQYAESLEEEQREQNSGDQEYEYGYDGKGRLDTCYDVDSMFDALRE